MGSEMKRIKKERDFFTSIMMDQATSINQYLSNTKINFKNTEQILKLIEYYNAL